MMGLTLFKRGHHDRRIKKHLHRRLVQPHSPEPFITDVLKHACPVLVRLSGPLVHPEPIDFYHRRVWRRYPEQHAIGLFVNLQFHVWFQTKLDSQRFRDDDSP